MTAYLLRRLIGTIPVLLLISLLVFIVFARERPVTPPCAPGMEVRSLVFDGFKQMFRQKQFILLLVIFFIGLGTFNAVTTWIEDMGWLGDEFPQGVIQTPASWLE